MCEPQNQGEGSPNTLANSDVIKLPDNLSLSDSDPEDPSLPFHPELEDLSSSSGDDEPGDLGPTQHSIRPEPSFSLRGGSSSFSDRSRSIFDCLEKAVGLGLEKRSDPGLEKATVLGQDKTVGLGLERHSDLGLEKATVLAQEKSSALGLERPTGPCLKERLIGPVNQDRLRTGPGLEDHLRDGVFARPSPPPPLAVSRGGKSSRGVPDYLVHPERWTRYSLEDVPETSDRQNSTVAQQYIQSLQQRKKASESTSSLLPEEPFTPTFNQGHNSSSQHKIVFSKPSQAQIEEAEDEARDGARGRGVGLRHPDLEDEEDEGLEEGERKRKRPQDEEEEQEQPKLGFTNFKKVNRKNFRKSTKTDED